MQQCTMSALAPEELESVVLKELRERFCNVYSLTMPQTSQLHLFVLHGIFMVKWKKKSGDIIHLYQRLVGPKLSIHSWFHAMNG